MEHSVANMYIIPYAMLVRWTAPASFWEGVGRTPADFPNLTWQGLLGNLTPVTLGNIIGGTLLVGVVYWWVYLRRK
jgi:formate transporter